MSDATVLNLVLYLPVLGALALPAIPVRREDLTRALAKMRGTAA